SGAAFPFTVFILARTLKSSRQNPAFCDIISANVQGRRIFLHTAGKESPPMDFEQLKQECLACRKCGLCETRTNVVFGTGPKTAEVMLIGEGPGKNEDEQGLPFVGR